MRIISHRGFWLTPEEKNAPVAFERTVRERFGTETDVRDVNGALVVAHDPATTDATPWSEVVEAFEGTGLPLAVNVKADGLASLIAAAFHGRGIDWFAFDMSNPEMLKYHRAGLPFYTRHSDIETTPVLYEAAAGVWLDAFEGPWFDAATIVRHRDNGKDVCVVSPELHGRAPQDLWRMLVPLAADERLMLCTDQPDRARAVLGS